MSDDPASTDPMPRETNKEDSEAPESLIKFLRFNVGLFQNLEKSHPINVLQS
jgi:hypothetical protein